jgi:hypothetical protein
MMGGRVRLVRINRGSRSAARGIDRDLNVVCGGSASRKAYARQLKWSMNIDWIDRGLHHIKRDFYFEQYAPLREIHAPDGARRAHSGNVKWRMLKMKSTGSTGPVFGLRGNDAALTGKAQPAWQWIAAASGRRSVESSKIHLCALGWGTLARGARACAERSSRAV